MSTWTRDAVSQGRFFRFFRPAPREDTLDDVARRMEENENRWGAIEAELPPKPTPRDETEHARRRRALRVQRERLAQRNMFYRKDETGLSPADRYFGK